MDRNTSSLSTIWKENAGRTLKLRVHDDPDIRFSFSFPPSGNMNDPVQFHIQRISTGEVYFSREETMDEEAFIEIFEDHGRLTIQVSPSGEINSLFAGREDRLTSEKESSPEIDNHWKQASFQLESEAAQLYRLKSMYSGFQAENTCIWHLSFLPGLQ